MGTQHEGDAVDVDGLPMMAVHEEAQSLFVASRDTMMARPVLTISTVRTHMRSRTRFET